MTDATATAVTDAPAPAAAESAPLTGFTLVLAGLALAMSNFMVVLDATIAQVAVPQIAGSLGVSLSEGTWIITSYAVAEAITVPLTGWLAARFGAVRTYAMTLVGFGVFSVLCGFSTSLGMLVACRVGQGLCGGPLLPLSQTLLLRIFPKDKQGQAMGLWAITTVIGPVLGPILGGTISDGLSWHWIFFINIPVAGLCTLGVLRLLQGVETPTLKMRVDVVGLALVVLWIGALQILLDTGREHEWFGDSRMVALAVIAAVGFAVFLAWELTEAHPVVDLRVFRHLGFTVAALCQALSFAAFLSTSVLIPQWLQYGLGYPATNAGYASAFMGVAAIFTSPIVAKLTDTMDPRPVACVGILWMGLTSLMRLNWTSDADFWTLALPQLLQGAGMPFFFVPTTAIALGVVEPREMESAAGVMSFLRTMAGAIGVSLTTTLWDNSDHVARSEIVARLNSPDLVGTLQGAGFSLQQTRELIEMVVARESLTLATTHMFLLYAVIFAFTGLLIWLSPRPRRQVEPGAAH